MSVVLSREEVQKLAGGYKRAADQLRILLRLGYWRAWRGRDGHIVLPRAHVESIQADASKAQPFPEAVIEQYAEAQKPKDAAGVRRAARLARFAPWADRAAMDAIYTEARRLTATTGIPHHVDHEIPLQGKRVSGLHVETNLRILRAADNIAKGNEFEPC